MGVEYSAHLAVGYEFSAEDMEMAFGRQVPEKGHEEDRYDPRTGEKLRPVWLVDREAHTTYQLPTGENEECLELFCREFLEAYLKGCVVHVESNSWDGSIGKIVIGPEINENKDDQSQLDRVTIGGSIDLDDLMGLEDKMEKIRRQLVELGLKPKRRVVTVMVSVY